MSNCDNWEDDWENDDDMDAKLKVIKGVLAPMMEKNANMKNKEKSSLNKDNEQKLLEQKKKQIALKKRQDELFGDASLDAIQDQYCDLEDRY